MFQRRNLLIATLSLHVLLAVAYTAVRITRRYIVRRAAWITTAMLAAMLTELIVVVVATIALLAGYTGLALTLAVTVALQRA